MKAILKICRNEFKMIFSDKGVLLILIGAMLIYPFFYPFPYVAEVVKNVPLGVVDHSRTSSSRTLVRMVAANEYIQIENRYDDLVSAKHALLSGKIGGILLIPNDFEKKVLRGEQASVSAYCDAAYFLIYKQVLKGIYYGSATFSAGVEIKRMMAKGLPMQSAMISRAPLSVESVPLFNPQGGYATYVVPAVLVLLLQQILLIGIGMLAGTQREQKKPLSAKEGHPVQQVIGKTIAYYIIYLVHSTYLFGILFRFYKFPGNANFFELFLFITPFLLASIFLALAISAFFRNREISIILLVGFSMPALFLTGFSWPRESIPHFLQILSYLLPSTPGVEGFLKLNQMGATLYDIYPNWLNLAILCTVYFILAVFSQWKQMRSIKKTSGPYSAFN